MADLYKLKHGDEEKLFFYQCHNCSAGYTGPDAKAWGLLHIKSSKHTIFFIEKTTTVIKEAP